MRFTSIQKVLIVTICVWLTAFFNQISTLTKIVRSHQLLDETSFNAELKDELMLQQIAKAKLKEFHALQILNAEESSKIDASSQSQGLHVTRVDGDGDDNGNDATNDNHESMPKTKVVQQTTKHRVALPIKNGIDCGCPHTCDKQALNKRTAKLVCKKRIEFLMEKYNNSELEACAAASETTPFADSHLPCEIECHPEHCKDMTEKPKMDISGLEMPSPMYVRYDGVVIVTKVLHPANISILKQMFCLLNAAYNRHVNYDLLVFTTIPWSQQDIQKLQASVAPAKLTVALEGPSLEEHLNSMSVEERDFLEKRCNVTKGEKLTWFHHCSEKNSHLFNNLGYSWQSEFRAYHIWKHEALKNYKYMFWIDSDAMATKAFNVDPMKIFIANNLNLMFDHFPGGLTRLPEIKEKMMDAYGTAICRVSLTANGTLKADICEADTKPSIRQVYGFHHITRLDLYRNETHQKFLKSMVSDYKFSRKWDDQLAVTVPAVMEDPTRTWDHRAHGVHLGLHHNTMIDGKERGKYYSYLNWWGNVGKKNWTVARSMCDGLIVDLG